MRNIILAPRDRPSGRLDFWFRENPIRRLQRWSLNPIET
jgi:hypothetical protein